MGFGVLGLGVGFEFWSLGLGFRVWDLGGRVECQEIGFWVLRFSVQGSGCAILGFRVWSLG